MGPPKFELEFLAPKAKRMDQATPQALFEIVWIENLIFKNFYLIINIYFFSWILTIKSHLTFLLCY